VFNKKSKGKKILVVFYGDMQAYPPTMNMLNYLSINNFDVTVICRGSNIGYSYLNECINIIALNKNISVQQQMYGSKILKCYLYMHFIVRVFLFLKIKTPKIILAYDISEDNTFDILQKYQKQNSETVILHIGNEPLTNFRVYNIAKASCYHKKSSY
jgi:hypothetical protein